MNVEKIELKSEKAEKLRGMDEAFCLDSNYTTSFFDVLYHAISWV